jgi:hypothetical protein
MDPDDPYIGTFGGEPAGGPSEINAPPPPPQAPAPPPQAAYAQAPAATTQPAASGLAGLFGLFGGGGLGGGGVTTTAGTPGAAPGINQSMIGLGLGMLGGNVFNKWGPALRGYQTGAAADLARQQQVNQYGYQQQSLALQREHMGLQRELAYRPQIHYQTYEDPDGIVRTHAFMFDPRSRTSREMSLGDADKFSNQGVPRTLDPLYPGGPRIEVPYGSKFSEYRKRIDATRQRIATGEETAAEADAKRHYDNMKAAEDQIVKDDLDKEGIGWAGRYSKGVGALPSWAQPPGKAFDYNSAKETFLTGVARRKLNASELATMDRTYFPQPGDDAAAIKAKRALRQQAIETAKSGMAPVYRYQPQKQGPQVGERKQFKQGWGVWNGTDWVPEAR